MKALTSTMKKYKFEDESRRFAGFRHDMAIKNLNKEIERRITPRNMLIATTLILAIVYFGCRLIFGW